MVWLCPEHAQLRKRYFAKQDAHIAKARIAKVKAEAKAAPREDAGAAALSQVDMELSLTRAISSGSFSRIAVFWNEETFSVHGDGAYSCKVRLAKTRWEKLSAFLIQSGYKFIEDKQSPFVLIKKDAMAVPF